MNRESGPSLPKDPYSDALVRLRGMLDEAQQGGRTDSEPDFFQRLIRRVSMREIEPSAALETARTFLETRQEDH